MGSDPISEQMSQFSTELARISELKAAGDWDRICQIVATRLESLVGLSPSAFAKLTSLGVVAELIKGCPTPLIGFKKIIVIAILKEAGDYAEAKHGAGHGHGWYLRALNVRLSNSDRDLIKEHSTLVPSAADLVAKLGRQNVPLPMRILLITEYEEEGFLSQAVDELEFGLARWSDDLKFIRFGIAFYKRLLDTSDIDLVCSGLARCDVDSKLNELTNRKMLQERRIESWKARIQLRR